jgi:subtilase family serine protease
MQACNKVLRALLDKGITVFAASGDDGARDDDPSDNNGLNADFPASSPYAFGCGGTTITNNDIQTEKAWSSGGGGVSMYFPVPEWQVCTAPQCRSSLHLQNVICSVEMSIWIRSKAPLFVTFSCFVAENPTALPCYIMPCE